MGYFYALYGTQLSHTSTVNDVVTVGNSMPLNVVEGQPFYTAVGDNWQRQTQQLNDGYFSTNIALIFDTFAAKRGRPHDSLFRYVFAEPNGPEVVPRLGAPHTGELNFFWGVYAMQKHYVYDLFKQAPGPLYHYTPSQIQMGNTIQKYIANFIHTGSPSASHMNAPTWSAISTTEKHTMVFQSSVHHGAMLDPCVMLTSCYKEPTADFRRSQVTMWTSALTSTPAPATCSGSIDIGYSHVAPFQYPSDCEHHDSIPAPSPALVFSASPPPPKPPPPPPSPTQALLSAGGTCGGGCKFAFVIIGIAATLGGIAALLALGKWCAPKRIKSLSITRGLALTSPAKEVDVVSSAEWA